MTVLLVGCAGDHRPREKVGIETDGLRYSTGSFAGFTSIWVYPSGRILWSNTWYQRRMGRPGSKEVFDRRVWDEISQIIMASAGSNYTEWRSEDVALCDGGETEISARFMDRTAIYIEENGCEGWFIHSDEAGRRLNEVMEELYDRMEEMSPDRMRE